MNDLHAYHQTDLPIKLQILNISINLARIANWVEISLMQKKDLIDRFMKQTASYVNDLEVNQVSDSFKPTLVRFKEEFFKLKQQQISVNNRLEWSEKILTWADILQIRSKLIS